MRGECEGKCEGNARAGAVMAFGMHSVCILGLTCSCAEAAVVATRAVGAATCMVDSE